jgi:hypothetical protein
MSQQEHEEESTLGFYFGLRIRSIITIPPWLLFGKITPFLGGGIPTVVSYVPMAVLPSLWHGRRPWGIVKIVIFGVLLAVSALLAGFVSAVALSLLDNFTTLRAYSMVGRTVVRGVRSLA